jgi:DNA-binding transcriptional ArsR family regulator
VTGGRRVAVVVGPGAGVWVRRLGPTAWVVLETLVASGDGDTVTAGVRSLAAELDLSKDTVARALLALRHAGLVEPLPALRDTGRFTHGGYRLHLSPHLLEPAAPDVPVRLAERPSARDELVTSLQLSLLDPI